MEEGEGSHGFVVLEIWVVVSLCVYEDGGFFVVLGWDPGSCLY